MSTPPQAGSRWPRTLGALGCFAFAYASLSQTHVGAPQPDLPMLAPFVIYALIAVGIGSGAQTTQSTAAWIGLTAYLGSKFLVGLQFSAYALLDGNREPNQELMVLAYRALAFLETAALLIWSKRSLWRGSAVVARVLSLALLAGLAIQVHTWFSPVGEPLPIDNFRLAITIQWVTLGLVLLRLDRHAATTPRSHAGLPPDLPGMLVSLWVVAMVLMLIVATLSAWQLRGGGEAKIEPGVATAGIVIATQCLPLAAVLWFVLAMGPGPLATSASDEHESAIVDDPH